ncbi:DDB1- and CUL4-associated factor 8 [Galendromus occidentalis]|uniref:DDB1- and CUL4-associated factor 8 n=1 Tax=Galendromus occidentalis TaxID=34638 RepID=A0AAJ7SER4_9ACAR|nr:DDB1- and CUL4-associated factor 8 [Galendromus occidentalis]
MHKWSALLEFNRFQTCGKARTYRRRCYGNLHMAQRLELMAKLEGHWECVNSLNFNAEGDLLVSGSDDLQCQLWEWQSQKLLTSFSSRHRSNVFQSKFMPHKNNQTIITSSHDGSIRIHQLDEAGSRGVDSRKIGFHRGPVHKIAMHPALHETILTAGEDGCVLNIDIRLPNPINVVTVRSAGQPVGLYSIAINPLRPSEFVTGGKDQFVRVFDRRNAKPDDFVRELCPDHLVSTRIRCDDASLSVSEAVYNFDGTEILASYSDEDIYLFANDISTIEAKGTENSYLHQYQGHRNNDTVKGVNYFGQRSEFIVSGSDCGHIYIWDKESSHIVNFLFGDEDGALNCVEPNPTAPFLATSGFDHNVKIWAPSAEEEPSLQEVREHTIQNMRQRHQNLIRDYCEYYIRLRRRQMNDF